MKFFHLSDLHIGKQLNERSLIADQREILAQVVEAAEREKPEVVVIAGDVYDRTVPSAEAVMLFDEFLTQLAGLPLAVLLISGNHDSAERLDYGSSIFEKNNIYMVGTPPKQADEFIRKVTLSDENGPVHFYLLPFVKPGYLRRMVEEPELCPESYDAAVRFLLEREQIDCAERNVLVSHQFYTSGGTEPERCESEMIRVGGLDNVDVSALQAFDYVALGHIHGAQKVGQEWIRYAGTLLKYSVSEQKHHKHLLMVEMQKKGAPVLLTQIPLKPLHDVYEITGSLAQILEQAHEVNEDYVSIVLTDENELYRPKDNLLEWYPNLLNIRVRNSRTDRELEDYEETEHLTPQEAFAQFFEQMQGRTLAEEEQQLMNEIFEKVRGRE